MTTDRFKKLLDTYLYVFDIFATSKSEVAQHFQISPDSALVRLKKLEEFNLITRVHLSDMHGGMAIDSIGQPKDLAGSFKELTWQAFDTYDDRTPAEAVINFLEGIVAPTQEALEYAGKVLADRGGDYTTKVVGS